MNRPAFHYEEPERFGESLTTARPWNRSALADVERLNGRVAMLMRAKSRSLAQNSEDEIGYAAPLSGADS